MLPGTALQRQGPTRMLWGKPEAARLPMNVILLLFLLVEEEKVIRYSYSRRRIRREPPCVTQGAGDRPEGIAPTKNPLAKFVRQELPYPRGRWLVDGCEHSASTV